MGANTIDWLGLADAERKRRQEEPHVTDEHLKRWAAESHNDGDWPQYQHFTVGTDNLCAACDRNALARALLDSQTAVADAIRETIEEDARIAAAYEVDPRSETRVAENISRAISDRLVTPSLPPTGSNVTPKP